MHPRASSSNIGWASEFGLTLAQVATAEKSNEITAIPTLLSLVDIHGAILTIDAMGTQTPIAERSDNVWISAEIEGQPLDW